MQSSGVAAAALLGSLIGAEPALAGLTQRLDFDFGAPPGPELSLDAAFPATLGICDSADLTGGLAPACSLAGPAAASPDPDARLGFDDFEFVFAVWEIGTDWSLGLFGLFNAVIRGDGTSPQTVSGALAVGPAPLDGLPDLQDEACFDFGRIEEPDDAIARIASCEDGASELQAALRATALDDAVATPAPSALALLPPTVLGLLATQRRRRPERASATAAAPLASIVSSGLAAGALAGLATAAFLAGSAKEQCACTSPSPRSRQSGRSSRSAPTPPS